MKKEDPIYHLEWFILIALAAFLMCISAPACTVIKKLEHNMDQNYRAKNGLPLKDTIPKPTIAKF